MLNALFTEALGGTPSLNAMWNNLAGANGLQNTLGGQPEHVTGGPDRPAF